MLERLKALFISRPGSPEVAKLSTASVAPALALPPLVRTPPETRTEADPASPEPVLVHREVLDDALAVRGVEFFIRGELQDKVNAGRSAMRRFLDGMLLDHLASLRAKPLQVRCVWVQVAEASLLRLGTARLPPQACVLLVPDDASRVAGPDTREALLGMQEAGHQVWLDDCLDTPWFASLANSASGATLRMAMRLPIESADALRRTRDAQPGLRLGAWDVSTLEDYELARKFGCKCFSGSFVTRREDWTGRELSPQMMNVASMINRIREEANFRAIAQVLKQDMAMSYRLLRYVNAATQGLSQRIASIEQGLMILGQDQLDRWLTLVLLSGGAMGDTALTEVALIRARFLELLGAPRFAPEQCERLFVLGLFSMLDVALKVPLEAAIAPLRLQEVMNDALLRREGPYGPYLALADACERGIAHEICKYAVMLGLTTRKVSALQIEAINWVAHISAHPAEGQA